MLCVSPFFFFAKRAHCWPGRQRTHGWPLLSPAVGAGKHNTNRGHVATVVGGSGRKDMAGGVTAGNTKEKQWAFGSNRWEQESEHCS